MFPLGYSTCSCTVGAGAPFEATVPPLQVVAVAAATAAIHDALDAAVARGAVHFSLSVFPRRGSLLDLPESQSPAHTSTPNVQY